MQQCAAFFHVKNYDIAWYKFTKKRIVLYKIILGEKIIKNYSITILRKRLFIIILVVALLFIFVLGRLFYVQIIWGNDLQEKAIDQWTREIPVIASRGKITDVNGVILADNNDTYTVFVRKKAVINMENTTQILSDILGLDYEYVYKRLTTTVSSEVTVKKQVEKDKIALISEHDLSGVYYSRDNCRIYPYNNFLTSVLGFTSTDGKGQSGLELYYDKYLQGIDGEILYETDIVGVEIEGGKASYKPATNGLNIKLTIDYDVQQLCESAMEQAMQVHKAKSAQMIVLDPKTGAIRALASKPSFNLNEIPRDDLTSLNALGRNGLICDIYEPGSTFKILTAAANIEEYLNGNKNAFSINHVYKNGKHSSLTLQGALNNSCNPIFVDIAMSLGKETMYKYIDLFGYGKVTGVDFSGEAQGMVLPVSSVQNVDLARIAFGQTIAVTGIQLASATCAAINGGKYYTPYLVSEIYTEDGIIAEKIQPKINNRVISENASEILNKMLEQVVSEGSGKQAYIEGYRVAGKTGTAQKYQNGIIAHGKYVSSFVGYFPANDPKYLALVIIDEPEGQYYGSTVAAPYAKQVFEGIIKLKNMKSFTV